MRALTLTQPWAGLVASGIKRIENRPRPMIRSEDFDQPFAIHASREIDEDVYERIHEIAPELFGYDADGKMAEWYRLSRITSAIIGVARVVDMIDLRGQSQLSLAAIQALGGPGKVALLARDQRRFVFGPIAYVLEGNRALPEPVTIDRGFQCFWYLKHADVVRVAGQLL